MNKQEYSKNDLAEKVMGRRPEGYMPFDQPCELGYHCPVCKYDTETEGYYDERLHWSEYNCFIWCSICNKDYPSALCMPNIDRAIDVFLCSVQDAVELAISKHTLTTFET